MRPQLTPYKRMLAIRDGKECFFCGIDLPKDELTIEHLLSVEDGGSHKMNNLCLSCKTCNTEVIGMSVVKKFKYREEMREVNAQA